MSTPYQITRHGVHAVRLRKARPLAVGLAGDHPLPVRNRQGAAREETAAAGVVGAGRQTPALASVAAWLTSVQTGDACPARKCLTPGSGGVDACRPTSSTARAQGPALRRRAYLAVEPSFGQGRER